jgi:hypothetical protein
MAKHSNRRGRRGKKQKSEQKRAEARKERERYEPEQREERLKIFIDTVGQIKRDEEEHAETEDVEMVDASVSADEANAPSAHQEKSSDQVNGQEQPSKRRELGPRVNFGLVSEALTKYLNDVKEVLDNEDFQEEGNNERIYFDMILTV